MPVSYFLSIEYFLKIISLERIWLQMLLIDFSNGFNKD